MFDALGLGECLIDFIPGMEPFTYHANPGGAVANVMAMMARLGSKTAFIGKIGDDDFGHLLAERLQTFGVDTTSLVWSKKYPTTLAIVQMRLDGDREYLFYRKRSADVMLKSDQVDDDKILNTRLFHFGSLSLSDEPSRSATLMSLEFAKERGCLVSFDPNYRSFLWDSPESAISEILAVMPQVDIVKLSLNELRLITGENEADVAARTLLSLGPKLILVTMGPAGSTYYTTELQGLVATPEVEVVDTVGAGDAFFGAFLAQFLKENYRLEELSDEVLGRLLEFANRAAALSTTKAGAMAALPSREEIENW